MFLFFFSSRRRHTRYIGDWSSDVCSSDLAQSGSQQRRESAAQKVIFRVESAAKDERVVVEGQLRAAGVEGVKTTQKIQRHRPMVRDMIADTQAEQGGVVHFESGAEFREINGVAEQKLGASIHFPRSLPVPAVFGACRTAAE